METKRTPSILASLLFGPLCLAQPAVSEFIHVDQFGYRPGDQKVAVIADPITGYNSALSFQPGANYEVREWGTGTTMLSGTTTSWNGGQVHDQSGDVVWWFDFSALNAAGDYYIYDVANNVRSDRFTIGDCVYEDALKAATRAFFYQRCGGPKPAANAGAGWSDTVCHLGALQDGDCRNAQNPTAASARDLRGGWHDAGDHNKYVNWTFGVLTDLLLAYEENPATWGDDNNIPESGNGTPDLLDEVRWELDWLMRMEQGDGSTLAKVAVTLSADDNISPPSVDQNERRYSGPSTSSAYTVAAVCALGAIEFNAAGDVAYAEELESRAILAYDWAVANPGLVANNTGLANPDPEEDQYGTDMRRLAAACYLFARTGNSTYREWFDAHYTEAHLVEWGYAYPFEAAYQDALLYYGSINGSTASIVQQIEAAYSASMSADNADNLPAHTNGTDAYRAYLATNNYTWGSNTTKGHQASMFLSMNTHGLDALNADNYTDAAEDFVHYFHGVNPNGVVFLTNMNGLGAEHSANCIYHGWFGDGSALWDEVGVSTYGPPPGFVPGGANPTYDWDGCCPDNCGSSENNALCFAESIEPPKNQPAQKAWKDFNTSWPLNSWTVQEIGIYTQAAYVRAVSRFTSAACLETGLQAHKRGMNAITVVPSPTTGQVSITTPTACTATVLDATGRVVRTFYLRTGATVVDVTGLSNGVYVLNATRDNWTSSVRFVKE